MPEGKCDRCHAQGVPIGMSKYTEGIFFWQCSQCENRWHAHPEGTAVHEQAQPFVERGRNRA